MGLRGLTPTYRKYGVGVVVREKHGNNPPACSVTMRHSLLGALPDTYKMLSNALCKQGSYNNHTFAYRSQRRGYRTPSSTI